MRKLFTARGETLGVLLPELSEGLLFVVAVLLVGVIAIVASCASKQCEPQTDVACWTASATVTPQMQVVELQGGVALWVTANADRVCVQPVGEGW